MLAKDERYLKLKGGPYPGGYIVVVHTDEEFLSPEFIRIALEGYEFRVQDISRAFVLLSYRSGMYPYFELSLRLANKGKEPAAERQSAAKTGRPVSFNCLPQSGR